MKIQWIALIAAAVVAVVLAFVFFTARKGPKLDAYLFLKEPRIVSKPDEKVLEVKFEGPADIVVKEAYSVLFKTYFRMKGVPKGPGMAVPKARYAMESFGPDWSEETLKNQSWKGAAAIPLPPAAALSPAAPKGPMAASIGLWEYGETAEILHLGSYETEKPTIDRLLAHIAAQGYTVYGDHEEEYLKGPGMGNIPPKDYWTVIRYRVRKAK